MGKMVITDAGIAEVVNAENTGTAPVTLTHIAFGTGQYTATAERTALQAEFKRFDAISGGGVGDNVFHITMEDDSADAYTVYEVGVFTESGTLFAVYSQNTPIIQKSAGSIGMLAVDILLDEMNPESVTIGDTNFQFNPATTERKGVIEIATETEAKAATDTERAITAATLQAVIQNHSNIVHRSGAETISGAKTFTVSPTIKRENPYIYIVQSDITKGNAPTATSYAGFYFKDANNADMAALVHNYYETGANHLKMQIFNPAENTNETAELTLGFAADGTAYASVPTPSNNDDNSTKVATTEWVTIKVKNYLPLSGGKMAGTIRSTLEGLVVGDTDTSAVRISGGTNWDSGASFVVCGKEHATYPGMFRIKASDGTNTYILLGKPDGTLTWGGANLLTTDTQNPPGTVIAFAGNTAPAGYLLCNGGTVSRTTYAKLFAAIGTTYGTGDGSTTFTLPNLTDKFIQGSGTAGTTKAAGLPNITGSMSAAMSAGGNIGEILTGGTGALVTSTSGTAKAASLGTNSLDKVVVTLNASKSNAIYGKSTTVQPPALTMRFYIKY